MVSTGIPEIDISGSLIRAANPAVPQHTTIQDVAA
jgi:hypothetical protein